MDVVKLTGAPAAPIATPARRLIAAGIKRGTGPLLVELPALSDADRAAHEAASYVRSTAKAA